MNVKEILCDYDTTENALVITEQCHVCCTCNSDPESQPSSFESKVWLLRPKFAEETHNAVCCSSPLLSMVRSVTGGNPF